RRAGSSGWSQTRPGLRQQAPQRVHSKRRRRRGDGTTGSFTDANLAPLPLDRKRGGCGSAAAVVRNAHDAAVASRPAYLFLALVVGRHVAVGSVLQVANPAFGIAFGELFFFVGLTWLFTRAQNFRAIDFLALRPPPARTVGAAALAAIAGFFFAGGMNALNRWIVGPEVADRYDVTHLFDFRSPLEGAVLVFGVSVLAPLGEELVFRGYLQRVLGARHGALRAALIGGALFALIHLNPASILALFSLGVLFGLMRVWTGSIWPAVLAHAVQNGTSSALVLSGAAENAPDELGLGPALLLIAFTGPVLWLAL